MKSYYRLIQGSKNAFASDAYTGNFVGVDFDIDKDLTHELPDNWRQFNRIFIPYFLEKHPEKSKIAAGLACGMLYTVAKGIAAGDVVLIPNGAGQYFVGEIIGNYEYHPGATLPHRRKVRWFDTVVTRESMSEALRFSAGSIGTVSNVSTHGAEIEDLIKGVRPAMLIATDETVENPSAFALEEHLEEFLVENWDATELGKALDIYEEEGEPVGQQYPSDTGPIDILALSKDKKEIVVIELKRGRASDVVVGQIQRYMGFVQDELAEEGQKVRGVIIGLGGDTRLQRALSVTNDIEFYKYKIAFSLEKSFPS